MRKLSLAAIAVVVAALLIDHGSSNSGVTIAASPRPAITASPQPAIAAFSRDYFAYLEGRLPVSGLAGATAAVNRVASQDQIPASQRSGAIRLTATKMAYVSDAPSAQATVEGADERHRFGFAIALRYAAGRWQIVYLRPPDLAMAFAPRYRPSATPSAVTSATTRFALAYVEYRDGLRRVPPAGLAPIREQIVSGQDPLADLDADRAKVTITSVRSGPPAGKEVAVTVGARAGGQRVSFSIFMEELDDRWKPWEFVQAGGA